jgi:hypothetical protein
VPRLAAGKRGPIGLQLCKYTCGLMDRRRATLIVIAVLALVDLVGAAPLLDAWNDRHTKAASDATPASPAKPALPVPAGDASAVHAGT